MYEYDSDCAQVNYPMCTLANTPRKPEHCVEYVRQQEWAQEAPFGGAPLDTDSLEHIEWIRERADRRARRFGIAGPGARGEITLQFTQGVVKHIIPTVASTNAVVAAICALEVFKLISGCVRSVWCDALSGLMYRTAYSITNTSDIRCRLYSHPYSPALL